MQYELSHDSIAQLISEKASDEMLLRRKIQKFIEEKHVAFLERNAQLTEDDWSYIIPHLEKVSLTPATDKYLFNARRVLNRRARNKRIAQIAIGSVLLIATLVSLTLWVNAERLRGRADRLVLEQGRQLLITKAKFEEKNANDLLAIMDGYKPNLYLISVGIDTYKDTAVAGCVRDAIAIQEVFKSQEGLLYGKVIDYLFTDSAGTKENIFQTIKEIEEVIKPNDVLLLYLSGIGSTFEANDSSNQYGTFMTHDAFGNPFPHRINGSDLLVPLYKMKPKVVLIADFSFSGNFILPLFDVRHSRDISKLTHNVFGISSSSINQIAKETLIDSVAQGVFSYGLTEAINATSIEKDQNGMLYLDELVLHTSLFVKKKVRDQDVLTIVPPTFSNIPLIQFGDQFFLPQNEFPLQGNTEDLAVKGALIKLFFVMDDQVDETQRDSLYQLFMGGNQTEAFALYQKIGHRRFVSGTEWETRKAEGRYLWNQYLLKIIQNDTHSTAFFEAQEKVKGTPRYLRLISMYDLPHNRGK